MVVRPLLPTMARSFAIRMRPLFTGSEFVKTEVDNDGVATVTMQHAPLNIFNYEFASSLGRTLRSLIANNPRAIILTSVKISVIQLLS